MSYQAVVKQADDLWQRFAEQENLSDHQLDQFKTYAALLEEWGDRMNLTAIEGTKNIIRNHFQDSLEVGRFVDMNAVHTICDVGSGGGFPGIPLKIKYPHLEVILIEVNHKKITFLDTIINKLKLEGVMVYDLDWRTFLRTTDYAIDLFLARASLHTDELVRMFKPGCPYKASRLIYWASRDWQPGKKDESYVNSEYVYQLGSKKRRYILLGTPNKS